MINFLRLGYLWSYIGRKKLNTIFIYNFDRSAVIIRLLYIPLDALWLWHWRKRFLIVAYFKMAPQSYSRVKFSALLRADHTKPCWSISHNCFRDQEAHGRWRRYQQTCRQWSKDCCGSWQLAWCHSRNCVACGMSFESLSHRASSGLNKSWIITDMQPKL